MKLSRPSLIPWLLKSLPRCRASEDTMFGTAEVLETEDADSLPIRVLSVEGSWESASYLDEGYCELVFPYHRVYNGLFELRPLASRYLMLGAGAFSWPKWLLAHTHDTSIDVVDIDPAMPRLARTWFGLAQALAAYDPDGTRLSFIERDARAFLEQKHELAEGEAVYDIILNDVYAADAAPRSLQTFEAAQDMRALLAPDGLYLANVVSALEGPDSQLLADIEATLEAAFGFCCVVPCSQASAKQRDNVVVVAAREPLAFPGMTKQGREERKQHGQVLHDVEIVS